MVKVITIRHVESAQAVYYKLKERFVNRYGWFIPGLHEKPLRIKSEKFAVKDTKRY
jgi:hypothetical protein